MFLIDQELSTYDFLKALGFVAPNNFDISYILTPDSVSDQTTSELTDIGFQPPVQDNNIKYFRKDPKSTHCFSRSNIDITDNTLAPMPVSNGDIKTEEFKQMVNSGANVKSPYKAFTIIESTKDAFSIELKESKSGLPKHSIISFSKTVPDSKKKMSEASIISTDDIDITSSQIDKICGQLKSTSEDFLQAVDLFITAFDKYTKSYNIKNRLTSKYKNSKIGNGVGLPGVIASVNGTYNITAIRKDSDSMKNALAEFKKSEYQKEMYLNNMKRAYLTIQNNMKALLAYDNNMDIIMQQAVQDDDWEN